MSTEDIVRLKVEELDALRAELERRIAEEAPRWNADPDDVQRSVAKLVLTLVEFLRKLMERQAIRRMENETLTPKEVEAVGLALMRLEETSTTWQSSSGWRSPLSRHGPLRRHLAGDRKRPAGFSSAVSASDPAEMEDRNQYTSSWLPTVSRRMASDSSCSTKLNRIRRS